MPSQLNLFDVDSCKVNLPEEKSEELSAWELDDLANRLVVGVVFPGGYGAVLDYLVPSELAEKIDAGMRVMVPLGRDNHLTLGYCVDVKSYGNVPHLKDKTLKFVKSLIDDKRLLNDNMIRLTHWIAGEYLCPIGQVLEAMLPAGVRSGAGTRLTTVLFVPDDLDKILNDLQNKFNKQSQSQTSQPHSTQSHASQPHTTQSHTTQPHATQSHASQSHATQSHATQPHATQSAQPKTSPAQNAAPKSILTSKQLHVLSTLRGSGALLTMRELQHTAKCSAVPIDALKRFGLIRTKTIRRTKNETDEQPADNITTQPVQHVLSDDQRNAIDRIKIAIRERRNEVFLLHGVTGSGKTEVYIQAIREAVDRNRQAIVLVPEISLTPQTVGRFKSRFRDVAVLHSHLTDAERHHQWSIIASGKIQVVVGTRSAVFAPLPRVGLIVIDEEHENSFKQGTAPRYHARDVARKRAEFEEIPLILGSATPSMESWYATTITQSQAKVDQKTSDKVDDETGDKVDKNLDDNLDKKINSQFVAQNDSLVDCQNNSAATEKVSGGTVCEDVPFSCTLISMPTRVKGLALPRVEIVDLRDEVRAKLTRGAIHRQLHSAISETINDHGQVILLLNRRGFSTHIQCPACGEVVKCTNCDVSLTHHWKEEIALCHYCDYQINAPNRCPQCGFLGIRYNGFGTEKLELEIKNRFPNVNVLRMDTDTMQGHGTHEKALTLFREGKVQILLGTQMIAKGLDFPNVTLVGVINADTALHLPDFRAAERTFHLITQVAGRTGRSERGGRVIVQTFTPDHPAIQSASMHDYANFVAKELPIRKLLGYPPYSKMIRIVIRGVAERMTHDFAAEFAQRLRSEVDLQNNNDNNEHANKAQNKNLFIQNKRTNNASESTTAKKTFKILGPAPAPFARLRGFYRFHLHIFGKNSEQLLNVVRKTSASIKTPDKIQWIIDVDPLDML
ncbi:MAG: primosomal protein N' [Planctomycetaceae bacterium]|jgi:primosomal protein N' (replication factor Y)|nr:primosomal protein N' [Planctomycetaceae bacterium]